MEQVDNLETRNFANSLLQELKKYQIKHKKLPDSFSPKNIRAMYLNLKAQNEKEAMQITQKTAEYLLYLFKVNDMIAESIDLTQNYGKLVKG
jgi:hypothetical protein